MKIRYLLVSATVILTLIMLVGCSSSPYGSQPTTSRAPTDTTSPATAGPNQTAVNIANLAFSPATVTVAKGATITWTNNDTTTHTVTSDNGIWDSGNVDPGKTYSRTFNDVGTWPYHCKIHVTMKAQVVVQ